MYCGKPIIGLVGGIGSGKSFVAKLFGELGCLVVDSDAQVTRGVPRPGGGGDDPRVVGRSGLARRRHNQQVGHRRSGVRRPGGEAAAGRACCTRSSTRRGSGKCAAAADDPQVVAYVWDTPLLLEVGLAAAVRRDGVRRRPAGAAAGAGAGAQRVGRGGTASAGKIADAPRHEASFIRLCRSRMPLTRGPVPRL